MSKIAGAADFIDWDVRNWSAALDFWRSHTRQDVSQSSALELGSRNGGISLWLALQGANVICSDLKRPGEGASGRHETFGTADLISYEAIDATNIPYANRFDIVAFKSLLGGLGTRELQAKAVQQMHRALKENGGELYFVENLDGSGLHRFLRRRFVPWGTGWRYVSLADIAEFMAPFSHVEYKIVGFAGAFGRTERQRNFFGRFDQLFFDRVLPKRWRYIIMGIATK